VRASPDSPVATGDYGQGVPPIRSPRNPPTDARTQPITVRVELNPRGGWRVATPDERERVTCETLDAARRVAYLRAADRRQCELIVLDAYHRVLEREFINDYRDSTDTSDHR
jgi:hypothetical protein